MRFFSQANLKKTLKKLSKNDLNLVGEILDRLASGEKLEPKHKDHPLVRNFKECRECHIKPDLLLVYKKVDEILVINALQISNHSKIFK